MERCEAQKFKRFLTQQVVSVGTAGDDVGMLIAYNSAEYAGTMK